MDPIIDNCNPTTQTCRPVVKPSPLDPYPRNRAAVVRGFVGKKVTLSTTGFHYVVGRLIALDDGDDMLVVGINDQVIRLARRHLATIQEADAALAEYVK